MDTEILIKDFKKRSLLKLNKSEKIILILGTIGLLFTIAVAIYVIAKSNTKLLENKDAIFAIIVIICSVFTFSYLFRGIFGERLYELIIYVISAISLMFYIVIHFIMSKRYSDPILITRLVVAVVISPLTAFIGAYLAHDYNLRGNLIFHTVGGLEELQKYCKQLFVFEALLQLDFQFGLCMVMLSIGLNSKVIDTLQYVALCFGIPFTVIWLIIGFLSMRYENKLGSYVFFVMGFVEPAYIAFIIYKTTDIIIKDPSDSMITSLQSITLACCLLALMIRIILLIMSIVVIKVFGRGLKEKMTNSSPTPSVSVYNNVNEIVSDSDNNI